MSVSYTHLDVYKRQAKHNDYAVFVEGTDTTAEQFAAMLSISLQSIKQYHDEKFDKTNFIKNVVLDNILPGDIYAKAREPVSYTHLDVYKRQAMNTSSPPS